MENLGDLGIIKIHLIGYKNKTLSKSKREYSNKKDYLV